jgi:hypothetical protein
MGENVLAGGPLLVAKAEELAKLLKCKDFMCTTAWIDRFEFCHNLSCGKMIG